MLSVVRTSPLIRFAKDSKIKPLFASMRSLVAEWRFSFGVGVRFGSGDGNSGEKVVFVSG